MSTNHVSFFCRRQRRARARQVDVRYTFRVAEPRTAAVRRFFQNAYATYRFHAIACRLFFGEHVTISRLTALVHTHRPRAEGATETGVLVNSPGVRRRGCGDTLKNRQKPPNTRRRREPRRDAYDSQRIFFNWKTYARTAESGVGERNFLFEFPLFVRGRR